MVGKVAGGQVECKEEGSVTQLCVKGKDGEDRVIEFKTVRGNKWGFEESRVTYKFLFYLRFFVISYSVANYRREGCSTRKSC